VGARRETIEHLTDAIQELGRHDAAEVLAEARAGARARVRAMLTDALAEAMLDHAREQLQLDRGSVSDQPRRPEAEPTARPDRERSASAGQGRDGNRDPGASAEPAWYVYGVVAAQESPAIAELHDADARQPLETVTEGPLSAVISRVPGDEFAETQLRANLNDMGWVEAVARGHEGVLDALCKRTTVIPMRLCTVYRAEAGVREMLQRESDTFLGALEQLGGKTEWGVKVFFERPRRSRPAAENLESSDSGSGAAYMNRRRRDRDDARLLDEEVEVAVTETHERLASLSADSTLNPPQRAEVTAHSGEMVLNGAYLVENENESPFHERAQVLRSRFKGLGLDLVVTGPWPAYNFLPGRIGAAW
jgi:hypothetical protein